MGKSTGNGAATGLSGVILAGGLSVRFGSDKASALLLGRPLLSWVVEAAAAACERLFIVKAKGQTLPPLERHVTVVEDRYEARGPVAGLAAGLGAAERGYCFATSCDAPMIQPSLIRLLRESAEGKDGALAMMRGYAEPLVAVYRAKVCARAFEAALAAGEGRIMAAIEGLDVARVPEEQVKEADPDLLSFVNVNHREALRELEERLRAGGANR